VAGRHYLIDMPRNARCVMPGLAYHVTQRGTNRQRVFFTAADRSPYLRLLHAHLADAQLQVWAWCLMENHVHFVVVPEREDSLSLLFRIRQTKPLWTAGGIDG